MTIDDQRTGGASFDGPVGLGWVIARQDGASVLEELVAAMAPRLFALVEERDDQSDFPVLAWRRRPDNDRRYRPRRRIIQHCG